MNYEPKPWSTDGTPEKTTATPIADIKAAVEAFREHSVSIEDWCEYLNTSDEPEAVAFRERWARTPSGRGDKP